MTKDKISRVRIALAFLEANPDATPYQAAKHAKIDPTSIYQRLNRDKAKAAGICRTCKRPI